MLPNLLPNSRPMKVQFPVVPPQHRLFFSPEPQGQIRPDLPPLPIEPFLNVSRTPLLQVPAIGGRQACPAPAPTPDSGSHFRKGYRRVMRQTERATRRAKIVLRVFETALAGNAKLDPALLQENSPGRRSKARARDSGSNSCEPAQCRRQMTFSEGHRGAHARTS